MKVRLLCYILILTLLSISLLGCLRSADGNESALRVEDVTEDPTDAATDAATEDSSEDPTESATEFPSETPTETPTDTPTESVTESPTESATETTTEAPTESTASTPNEDPFPLGIYISEGGGYTKVDEYVGFWPMNDADPMWRVDTWTNPGFSNLILDVAYFGIFPFDDETHPDVDYSGEYMRLWREAGLDGYKIGLELEINLYDKTTKRFTVLSAEDTFAFEEYMEIYLYDDVANAGKWWYSHITADTTNESTLITTFKITLRRGCYSVSDIRVTAFVYADESEFDDDGFYTGEAKTSIRIVRKKTEIGEKY